MIAIDTGYSGVKVHTNGRSFKFPTAVATKGTSTVRLDEKDQSYDFNGKRYYVGDLALDQDDKKYARKIDFIMEYAPLLVAHGIETAGVDPKVLSVGLPLANYKEYRDQYKKKLSKFMVNDKVYAFDEVYVWAQGVGILNDWLAVDQVGAENGYVLDIGFNTLIMLRFKDSQAKQEGSKQVDKAGISRALESLGKELVNDYSLDLNLIELNDVFTNGFVMAGYGKRIDLVDSITKHLENYIDSTLQQFEDGFDKYLARSTKLIIAGGGAYHIKKYLPKKYKEMTIIPETPEFSNVRGYFTAALAARNTL